MLLVQVQSNTSDRQKIVSPSGLFGSLILAFDGIKENNNE